MTESFENLVDHTTFDEVMAGSKERPAPPSFVFGTMPADVSATYYSRSTLAPIGVYTARKIELSEGFVLSIDGRAIVAPQLNIQRLDVEQAIREFSLSGTQKCSRHLQGPYALIVGLGYKIYGHWLADMLPRLAVLDSAGIKLDEIRWLVPADMPQFGRAMLALLGFGEDQLVPFGGNAGSVLVDELLLPSFLHNGVRYSRILQRAAILLRQRLEARFGTLSVGKYPRRILIARTRTGCGSRALIDREIIETECIAARFVRARPELLPLLEQWRMFADAHEVIGEYGSALHASLFSAPGTVVCALRGSAFHPAFIQSGFGEVLAQPTGYVFGDTLTGVAENFRLRVEDVTACLDAVFCRTFVQPRALHGTGSDLESPGNASAVISGQRPGSPLIIDFRKGGNSSAYCLSGWSTQEESHIWTLGEISVLALPQLNPLRDWYAAFDVGAWVFPPNITWQLLQVDVNGHVVGGFVLAGRETLTLRIPRELLAGSNGVRLRLVHPNYASPKAVGAGDDNRMLAVSFHRVTISADIGEVAEIQ